MSMTFNRVEIAPNSMCFVKKANEGNVSSVCAYINSIRNGKESLNRRTQSERQAKDVARWSELEKIIASNAMYDAFVTGIEVPTKESIELLQGNLRPYILGRHVQFRKLFTEGVNVRELQKMISVD